MRSSHSGQVYIPHDLALFFTILIVSSIVAASVTWLYLNPRPVEEFFALGVLGENMMAEHYYPGDDPRIGPGELVQWHVTLYNHMGSAQYVSVRVKLLNQTTPPPDDMNHTPSSVPFFKEIAHVFVDNETWVFPFYWSVENVSWSGGSAKITAVNLNNVTITQGLDTTAQDGYNFRIVLELWAYGNETTGFQFGWRSGEEVRSAWNQIWFNLTAPTAST
ncbi:MAG: hypothetical protein ACETV0_05855 [Nitrososphaeria archaeon]